MDKRSVIIIIIIIIIVIKIISLLRVGVPYSSRLIIANHFNTIAWINKNGITYAYIVFTLVLTVGLD